MQKSLINTAACVRSQHTGHRKQVTMVEIIAVVGRGKVLRSADEITPSLKSCSRNHCSSISLTSCLVTLI